MELLSRGPLSAEVEAGSQNVCQLVGQWGVSWAETEVEQEQISDSGTEFNINTIIDLPQISGHGMKFQRLVKRIHCLKLCQ